MPATRAPNVFAGPYVDRASARRKDPEWLAAAIAAPGTRFVPVFRSQSLIQTEPEPRAVFWSRGELPVLAADEPIVLGEFRGAPVFAVEVEASRATRADLDGTFTDLRLAGGLLPADEAGLLAYARAMLGWRDRHRFCGACGAPTRPGDGGHVMSCTRAGCGTQFFPRIDPAIIVLVTDGERALLGRQASWPPGRYSTIAGFVEPGESFEDAVVREVRDETSVEVVELEYQSSQPWPFPSSLMIGFHARAGATRIECPDGELEDARWFACDEIAAGTPALPPPQSISFRLIAEWYERQTGRRLIDEPRAALWNPRR